MSRHQHNQQMHQVHQTPELVHMVALHLDTRSHLACLQVCRLWNDIFTPFFWRTVDEEAWPWDQLFKTLTGFRTEAAATAPATEGNGDGGVMLSELWRKYGRFIRKRGVVTKCLSRLKELRELEVKGQLQEVVITRLGPQFLPQVSTLHYSNNSRLSTEYLRATTNTTVSSLRIDHCVDTSHFRALLQAFPMLEDLVIYGVDRVLPSKDAVIVHHNLKRLSIGIIYGLLKARVQFPLLDTIHLHLIEDGFRRLESLLNQFPRLEHLIADNFMMAGGLRTYGSDEDVDKAKDKDSIEWPLKTGYPT
ncbi:hypothetical protein BGX29_007712 [Mortierella sp. GBA35]|nr:hypothetical protein BGX29_007712 [Mortierella sp. GBA35]